MNRRKALAFLGVGALAGCGGGGGGSSGASDTGATASVPQATGVQQTAGATTAAGSATAAPVTTPPAVAAAPAATRSIACWGDSITNLYASHLQQALPDRPVYNGGVVGQTSAQIDARVQADTDHKDWVSIFWYGHNDWYKDQVAANLAASIAALKPGTNFIVMSMLTWSTDLPGSTQYNGALQADLALSQKYPDNFLDIRSYLVSRFDPSNAQDVIDHANDQTPSSLRFDTIHLNDAGCDVVAARLREFISAKGW